MEKLLGKTVTVTGKYGENMFGLPKSDPDHSQDTWYYPLSVLASVECGAQTTTKTVQQKQVIATQPIGIDLTLAKYAQNAQSYQTHFLQTSGANPSSWVSYIQIISTGGRRRLQEGASIARWTLS